MEGTNDATLETRLQRRLFGMLIVVCGVFIGVGLALTLAGGREAAAAPLKIGDVREAHIVEIRDRSGSTILTGEFRTRVDEVGNMEKDAALADRSGRRVIGEVELEVPPDTRSDRRPELEVDIIGLPPRQLFTVFIDNLPVASFTTDDRGSIDMELQEGERPRE
jgi:hypothetical protein